MKHYRSNPHTYLHIIDIAGHEVPNVIEYDDETCVVTALLKSYDGNFVMCKNDANILVPLKITFQLPGSKILS